ncbi:MAG: hypothetical protein CL693_00330 [Cellvibrionaceae bacterium]|nr:hypothetical protein [Cellvibrionaceae bacterium]|tara:strand:- start:4302 stop:4817 length:516 start_codon:yes stop_codon:yes gene_type:complete
MKRKPIHPADNSANQRNSNKGSNGTNRQYDQSQGNRSKQKELHRKSKSTRSFVTFMVSNYQLHKLNLDNEDFRIVSKEAALSRRLISSVSQYHNYTILDISKTIKPERTGPNASGGLQLVKQKLGATGANHHWQYWVDNKPFVDHKHPGADFYELEYCPAIDGYGEFSGNV